MKFKFILFISIILFVPIFTFAASAGDIVFTEIAYDLKGADDGHEWVEIHNTAENEIDMTGWKFNDGANHLLNIPPKNGGQGAMTIPAGGYAMLAGNAAVFLTDHPGFSGTVIDTAMSLNNTSATLTILDKDGIAIDSVTYQKEWGANGNGMTLEKSGSLWKESAQEGGTPGAVNSNVPPAGANATSTEPLLPPQTQSAVSQAPSLTADAGENVVALVDSEILFDGSKSQGDGTPVFLWNFGDGAIKEGKQVLHKYSFPGDYIVTLKVSDGAQFSEDQLRADIYSNSVTISEFVSNPADKESGWIELGNQSFSGVDISGWGLSASSSRSDFKIPENTFLAGNGFLALSKTVTKISLPDTGGVYLFYPNGQIAKKVEYKKAPRDFAAVLVADNRYEWSSEQTPGMKNIAVSAAQPGKNIDSSQVSDDKKTSSQAQSKSLFVEYKKYNSVKSFIAEPALAYSVKDFDASAQEIGQTGAPNAALSYFALDRYRYAALVIASLVFFWWLFRFRKNRAL